MGVKKVNSGDEASSASTVMKPMMTRSRSRSILRPAIERMDTTKLASIPDQMSFVDASTPARLLKTESSVLRSDLSKLALSRLSTSKTMEVDANAKKSSANAGTSAVTRPSKRKMEKGNSSSPTPKRKKQ